MLISDAYREMQTELHRDPRYGYASSIFAETVANAIKDYKITDLLDYGAGKLRLKDELESLGVKCKYSAYEPAIAEHAGQPTKAHMVVCIDVLEHVEPDCLNSVLDHIRLLSRKYVFLTIHTSAAKKVLPDGRNAHLTQQPASWWMPKIELRFDVLKKLEYPYGFLIFGKTK
jgi:2-polyprenyl-3-methyl-5-hydroxy-6-metoxy-1,4-benzoquinol methylase